jgi:hypothetical protein
MFRIVSEISRLFVVTGNGPEEFALRLAAATEPSAHGSLPLAEESTSVTYLFAARFPM